MGPAFQRKPYRQLEKDDAAPVAVQARDVAVREKSARKAISCDIGDVADAAGFHLVHLASGTANYWRRRTKRRFHYQGKRKNGGERHLFGVVTPVFTAPCEQGMG